MLMLLLLMLPNDIYPSISSSLKRKIAAVHSRASFRCYSGQPVATALARSLQAWLGTTQNHHRQTDTSASSSLAHFSPTSCNTGCSAHRHSQPSFILFDSAISTAPAQCIHAINLHVN